MRDIVWTPEPDFAERTNVGRLMRRCGAGSYGELVRRSIADIGGFWDICLKDLGLDWFRPYTRVLDDSGGLPGPDGSSRAP